MRRELGVAVLVAALAAGAAWADRSKVGQRPESVQRDGKKPVRMQLSANAAEPSATLIDAAKTAPTPPESLSRALPKQIGQFAVKKLAPAVRSTGPALYSEVRAELQPKSGASIQLALVDWAGLQPDSDLLRNPLPPGKRDERSGVVREGLVIQGYPAVTEEAPARGTSRIQVLVTDRLHLTLKAGKGRVAELVEAARAIDLKKLAALVPAKAPAPKR